MFLDRIKPELLNNTVDKKRVIQALIIISIVVSLVCAVDGWAWVIQNSQAVDSGKIKTDPIKMVESILGTVVFLLLAVTSGTLRALKQDYLC